MYWRRVLYFMAVKKVLFNCHFLLFLNHVGGNHWTTIIVNMHEKMITHYNSLKVRYYNTSKGETHYPKLDGILQYSQERYLEEYGNDRFPISEWKILDSIVCVPQQKNGYDCGVFACMISEFVSRCLPLDNLTQNHTDKCWEIMARDIMNYNGKYYISE
jgi:sentrin-specific protease 1